jgi:tetratricopeptide (TPR) repeat protein
VDCPSDTKLDAYIAGEPPHDTLVAHLDDCTDCLDLVAALVRTASAEPKVGDVVGRYRLVRELGRGGMGIVFLAHDAELQREVAIKVVRRRGVGDVNLDARLRRESRLLARIHHPSVIAIYDVGCSDDSVFVAMELVRGVPLSRWLASRPRSWRDVASVIRQAAEGLAAAHEAGVLHRDVKPQNILIETREDEAVRVVVSDFGVARALEQPVVSAVPAAGSDLLTASGTAPGTIAYMAPEQLAGEALDVRADVFALAVTAWEALAGRRPFAGQDRLALRIAIDAGPPALAARVPSYIERALRRALDARSSHRTPTMEAFAAELAPPSRRGTYAVAAGIAIAIGGVALVNASSSSPPPRECSFAQLDGVWPSRSAPAAWSGVDGLVARIDGGAAAWRVQRAEQCEASQRGEPVLVEQVDCLDRWAIQLAAELDTLAAMAPSQPVVLGDVGVCRSPAAAIMRLYVTDDVQRQRAVQQARKRIRAIDLYSEAARRELDAAEPAILATGLSGPRNELALYRAHAKSEVDETRLRELATQAERDGDDEVAAHGWLNLSGFVMAGMPDPQRTSDLLAMADAAIRRLGDPRALRAEWYAADARAASVTGDAERVHRAVEAVTRLGTEDDHPWIVIAMALNEIGESTATVELLERRASRRRSPAEAQERFLIYGTALLQLGRPADAVAALEEAVKIAVALRPGHLVTLSLRVDLARALLSAGDVDRALAELDLAAPLATAPEVPPSAKAAYLELRGHAFDALGRHSETLDAMRAAVATWATAPHADPRSVASARLNLGSALTEYGKHEAALSVTRGAIDDMTAALGDANPFCANGYSTLGDILRRLNRRREARAAYEEALSIYSAIPADPAYVALAKRGLAFALPAAHRRRARTLAREALAAFHAHASHWQDEIGITEQWLARHGGVK